METKSDVIFDRELREKDFENAAQAIEGGKENLKNIELVKSLVENYKGKKATAPFEVIVTSAIFLNAKELMEIIEAMKYAFKMKVAEELRERAEKDESSSEDVIMALALAASIDK